MRSRSPCFTVDVEDFYEGMKALGHDVTPPPAREPGIRALSRLLEQRTARITLFVVGRHARAAGDTLRALAAAGHEIASHGPDHGRLPGERRALADWLRTGREMVEDVVGVPVRGFRSPRFDVPAELDLAEFRGLIAEAGFAYVSDTSRAGPSSPVAELPIALRWRVPIGGGSYQRLIPRKVVASATRGIVPPAVLYYHSYDFGKELPSLWSARSPMTVSQLLGRTRIAPTFEFLIDELGSQTCTEALDAVR
jgi:peptidoglycan/xylan/chitin deacetylase (PgdA/CDA1 family)